MGKMNRTKKFAAKKRLINPKDQRIKLNQEKLKEAEMKKLDETRNQVLKDIKVKEIEQNPVHMFFSYNKALGPPYHIIIDTNFINLSIQNKIDLFKSFIDCLLAKSIPYITDCVMGELEKFGQKYRLALRVAKDPRFQRIKCFHKGTYADDCIINQITQHKCYLVATCDKQLKSRIRKVPGIPIVTIKSHKYVVERLPDNSLE